MRNYDELKKDHRVQGVRFVGGGIGVVTLQPGLATMCDGQLKTTFYAYCFRVARDFVEGAQEMAAA